MNIYSFAMFIFYQNERCKLIPIFRIPKVLNLGIFIVGLESCLEPRYAKRVHPHGELALVGYKLSTGAQSARAFFVREISMRSHVMAELERDIFICAGHLLSLSTNPFQLCHPHLVVNGKAPLVQQERIKRA